MKRYLSEFDFRYNEQSGLGVEDAERAAKAIKGISGKRLTLNQTGETGYAYAEGLRFSPLAARRLRDPT